MSIRECDGADDGLIMHIGIDSLPVDDPRFSVFTIPCDCGSRFDDAKHELTWPHSRLRPVIVSPPTKDLPDISEYL